MKRLIISLLAVISATAIWAQAPQLEGQIPVEGLPYFLPKTQLHFRVLVERTVFTPGEFAVYGERLLRKQCRETPDTNYRIIGISMYTTAVPDSTKEFVIYADKKRTIFNADLSREGILMAINAQGQAAPAVPADYEPSGWKAVHPNPRDYMKEEILSASSTVKMVELTARDIYDIRTSRNELTRGQAEYNPTDNNQMQAMMAYLDKQENILLQAFEGYNDCDTCEYKFEYTPEPGNNQSLLFRFSKKLGMCDADDLTGAPYYINIEDLGIIPEVQTDMTGMKPIKDDPGIVINTPGKIKVRLTEGGAGVGAGKDLKAWELYAGQYGRLDMLSSNLFSTKLTTHLVLDPLTGNVIKMELEPLGKK